MFGQFVEGDFFAGSGYLPILWRECFFYGWRSRGHYAIGGNKIRRGIFAAERVRRRRFRVSIGDGALGVRVGKFGHPAPEIDAGGVVWIGVRLFKLYFHVYCFVMV